MKRVLVCVAIATALTIGITGSRAANAADGKAIYDESCGMCHNNMSPKLGDKKTWAPRIAKGEDALVESAIKGKGMMSPRGGNTALTDDEIRSAVKYIISKSCN